MTAVLSSIYHADELGYTHLRIIAQSFRFHFLVSIQLTKKPSFRVVVFQETQLSIDTNLPWVVGITIFPLVEALLYHFWCETTPARMKSEVAYVNTRFAQRPSSIIIASGFHYFIDKVKLKVICFRIEVITKRESLSIQWRCFNFSKNRKEWWYYPVIEFIVCGFPVMAKQIVDKSRVLGER